MLVWTNLIHDCNKSWNEGQGSHTDESLPSEKLVECRWSRVLTSEPNAAFERWSTPTVRSPNRYFRHILPVIPRARLGFSRFGMPQTAFDQCTSLDLMSAETRLGIVPLAHRAWKMVVFVSFHNHTGQFQLNKTRRQQRFWSHFNVQISRTSLWFEL